MMRRQQRTADPGGESMKEPVADCKKADNHMKKGLQTSDSNKD